MRNFLSMSVFAGLMIGIAGLVYLRVGGLEGAVLFAFGLLSVVMCGAQLYTGKAGYLPYKESWRLVRLLISDIKLLCNKPLRLKYREIKKIISKQ